jgi:Tol biopolymer transport system component
LTGQEAWTGEEDTECRPAAFLDEWRGQRRNERQLATECGNPDFSSNGKQIVFSSSRTGFELLFLMRRNGTNEHRIRNTRDMSDPVFSPNGRRIAATDFVGGEFEIFNIRRDGTQRINVSTNPGRADTEPTWQAR